jgi:hypothetical protein
MAGGGKVAAMRTHTFRTILATCLGTTAIAVWIFGAGERPAVESIGDESAVRAELELASAEHLANRLWLERWPDDERDIIGYLAFVDQGGPQEGIVGRASQYRLMLERFGWRLEGERLRVFFPQERTRGQVQARTWKCDAPKPFELCLELSNGRDKVMFYSSRDLELRGAEAIDALLSKTPELPPFDAGTATEIEWMPPVAAP